MKAATARKIFSGKLNSMAAVITGPFKFGGDLKALSVFKAF
jgi:putative sterol carrier protein